MRFWDTSSIVPLLVELPASEAVRDEFARDPAVIVWWATEVECTSAVARLEREGNLNADEVLDAYGRLAAHMESWQEIRPANRVRSVAERLLRVHAIRAADAFQIAAALVAADDDPHSLHIVTLDGRLALSARREGFPVVIPGTT